VIARGERTPMSIGTSGGQDNLATQEQPPSMRSATPRSADAVPERGRAIEG
jgi:hypothetical protein